MKHNLIRGNETGVTAADETLRLVARMPAPEGLEERVKARLKSARQGGHVLAWPNAEKRWSHSALVRGAAAAMIVCVVGGGAWGVYAHVQSGVNAARVMPAPIRQAAPGSFSNAGAMRSPQGEVLVHPVKPKDGKKPENAARTKGDTKDVHSVGNKLQPMKPLPPR